MDRLLNLNQIKLIDINDRFTAAFKELDNHCLVKIYHNCKDVNIIPVSNCLQYLHQTYHVGIYIIRYLKF